MDKEGKLYQRHAKKYETVIYDRTEPRKKGDYAIADDEVSLFWFSFVPHILVKGEIETSDFELCDLVR